MPNTNKKVIKRLLDRKSGVLDNYKIGLIIEGGGMRGAFSGGVMIGLEELGLTDLFDVIYASSSGSCSASYFLAKQAKIGTSIFTEDLTGFKFIKPWRFTMIMDLDYLCDKIFRKIKKLNTRKIRQSPTLLKIYLSNADKGDSISFTNKDDVDLIQVVKGSCAIPIFYNKKVKLNRYIFLDGGINKSIPIEDALTDHCSDLLIVTTVPEYYREKRRIISEKYIYSKLISPFTKDNVEANDEEYNEALDIAFGNKPIHRRINIYTISPDKLISIIETRKKVLEKQVENGKNKIKTAFCN